MDYSQIANLPCKITGGILWTAAYILIIGKGYKDKSYGMPFVALAFNFSWELVFSFIFPTKPPQSYSNIVWFLFDCVIVYQFVKHGRSKNEYGVPARWFSAVALITFILALLHTLTMSIEFHDYIGQYSAFTMNLTMSVLYVVLYFRRKSLVGQSLAIALLKMLGTACFSLMFFLRFPTSAFMDFLYLAILLFDVYYVVLIARHKEPRRG